MLIFLKAIFFGILVTLPKGPMGFLIVREMYLSPRRSWIALASGALVSDIFYGTVVVLSLHYISEPLIRLQYPLRIVAGIILVIIGIVLLVRMKKKKESSIKPISGAGGALLACITNPSLMVTFALVLSILQVSVSSAFSIQYVLFIAGLIIGVVAMWLCIERIVKKLHLNHTHDALFGMISAWVIIVSGIMFVVWSLVGISQTLAPFLFDKM